MNNRPQFPADRGISEHKFTWISMMLLVAVLYFVVMLITKAVDRRIESGEIEVRMWAGDIIYWKNGVGK